MTRAHDEQQPRIRAVDGRPRRRRLGAAILAAASLVAMSPGAATAATLPATPATFASAFAAARPGDTVLLSSGDYGVFHGAEKSGMVTVQAAPGATPTMSVDFRPASNITLDGLTITDLEIGDSATRHITVRNTSFPRSQAVIRTSELANADVVFDHDRFVGFDKCGDCYEGRVELPGQTSQPSGVTIENSLFSGGNSDGIQNGGNGVRIQGNEFEGIHQVDGSSGVHADAIQLYGSSNSVIRGNYFHDVATGIMAADGADHETIEDNVFAVSGSPFAVTIESDNGSVLRHNTLLDHGTCDYDSRCGTLYVGNKDGDPPSHGTIVTDNILTSVCVCAGSVKGFAQEDYNLFTDGSGSGGSDLRGKPTYVGGAGPTSYAGFRLAAGSLGKGTASDRADRGARIGAATGPGAPPAPPSPPPGGPASPPRPSGPVAAYGFGEAHGSRVRDASGHGNAGRIHGARRVRGHSGRGLWFDGRRDYVSVPASRSLHLRDAMTLEAWVRPSGVRRWQPVVVKRRRGGAAFALFAADPRGRPVVVPGVRREPAGRARPRVRRWTHLAVTFNGTSLRLYVNGRRAATWRESRRLAASRGPLLIGAGLGHHFAGRLDDLRVYSRALGAAAIRHDMRTPVS